MITKQSETKWNVYFNHHRLGETLVEVELKTEGLLVGGELIEKKELEQARKVIKKKEG
jgi:hypothetical protein